MRLSEVNVPEVIKFINDNGPEVFVGDDLEKYIDYFASIRRIFQLREEHGRLIAVACCNNVSSLDFFVENEWPEEDPEGKILLVHGIVIHRKLRHMGLMRAMLERWVALFPSVEYIIFRRHSKGAEVKVMPVSKILRRKQ